MNTEPWRNITD